MIGNTTPAIVAPRGDTLAELGRSDQPIRRQRVETPEEAERVGFGGSPTILVDGIDPFPDPAGPAGYA